MHLRLEPDGSGQLVIGASEVIYLNPSAALMTRLALEGATEPEAVAEIRRNFRVSAETARHDFAEIRQTIERATDPAGPCLIHDFDFETLHPFSPSVSAPYRMDLALTYRCNNECAHCYNARPRSFPELATQEWTDIVRRLWDIGIPHVCFTGGEATLREDLPELIQAAAEIGLVTGLLTNGRRLGSCDYTQGLAAAGLDHVQITLESHTEAIHDEMVSSRGAWRQTVQGVRHALGAGLFVMTNTTLLAANAGTLEDTIDFLADLGVPAVGLNALIHAGKGAEAAGGLPEASLGGLLDKARRRTEVHGQRLIWYTPTMYCHLDPVQMELGVKGCTAALYNMCIEPDGQVIPCQSFYQPVGHILHDSWDSIWNHEVCLWLRERRYASSVCKDCPVYSVCGGGCPLSSEVETPEGVPLGLAAVS